MYNFSGLIHETRGCFIVAAISALISLIILILFLKKKHLELSILTSLMFWILFSKKIHFQKNKETERNKRKEIRTKALIILTLCLSIYTLSCGCFYAYKLHNPTIVYQDCYYLRTYSWRKGRLRNENDYTFSDDENGKNVTFRMPNKEEIYPDKFSKDTLYRVYYEKSTSYIVKIEEIDE